MIRMDSIQLLIMYYYHAPTKYFLNKHFKIITPSKEEKNTSFDLNKRLHTLTHNDKHDYDDIVVDIDNETLTEQDIQYIQLLPQIISQDESLTSDLGSSFTLINLI